MNRGMKKRITAGRLLLFFALLLPVLLGGCGREAAKGKGQEDVYRTVLESLAPGQSYAFVEQEGFSYPLLLVADMVYDEGSCKNAAIQCTVYGAGAGKSAELGILSCDGTAYPLKYDKTGIYTAGGHEISRASVKEQEGSPVLYFAETGTELFDETGAASLEYKNEEGTIEKAAAEEKIGALYEKYEKARIISFDGMGFAQKFAQKKAVSVSVIGGADGPTSVFLAGKLPIRLFFGKGILLCLAVGLAAGLLTVLFFSRRKRKAAGNDRLLAAMISYDKGDAKRIQHFLKVYEFAAMIGRGEGLSAKQQHILETAAIVHDIGIRPAEQKYGRCDGKLQEQEGPAEAEKLLERLNYDKDVIKRVSYLVGHHHTYTDVDGVDYRILLEADFLVNLFEDNCDSTAIQNAYETVFCTETGRRICREMFG